MKFPDYHALLNGMNASDEVRTEVVAALEACEAYNYQLRISEENRKIPLGMIFDRLAA